MEVEIVNVENPIEGNNSTVVTENNQDSNETNVPAGDLVASENEDSKHSEGEKDEPIESEMKTDENSRHNDVETPKESRETDSSASKENENCENNETENSNTAETEESQSAEPAKSESPKPEKTGSADTQKVSSAENSEDKEAGKYVNENGQAEVLQNGDSQENAKDDDRRMEMDEDDDYEFNPLLFCPDILMDVEEAPVSTGPTDMSSTNDTTDPNSLFAPLFSTFVDEMTGAEISFNLTAEEQQLRERLYGPNNPIQFTKIHCTACNVHLGSALAGQTNRFVHPLLKVLICKECYHFYTSGEFEKDEDGSELYCRWCGQGGQVLCCTMCEFVFCKKCIRINFGRKKLTQVRDSDDWKCFRCDMSQLKALRAMCVEFFEFIRKETARASTYTDSDAVNKDLTNCCQTQNRKRAAVAADSEKEPDKEVVKKRRRKNEEDPDYNPHAPEIDDRSNSPVAGTSGVKAVVSAAKPPVSVQPKQPAAIRSEVSFPGKSPSSTVRIGNTVINVKSLGTTSTPARIASPTGARNTAVRTPASNIRPRPTFSPRTPQNAPKPPVAAMPGSLAQIRATSVRTPIPSSSVMKHEWFEKTVRAAARVNSNLSYTLTQLNKAQSSASSVEQLAVVHNKLQEILSSSINSLIQIRKNLRTEFIAGIKTIRFPPKPTPVDDDDVIIVNSDPSPNLPKKVMPAPAQHSVQKQVRSRTCTPVRASSSNTATKSDSTPTKGYLKVRSFSQLQNVSSECITIPDDDPPPLVSIMDPVVIEVNEDKPEDEDKVASKTKENDDKTNKNDDDAKVKENQDEEKTEVDGNEEKTKEKEESAVNDKSQETESKDEKTHKESEEKGDGKTKEKENGDSAGTTNGTKTNMKNGKKSSKETEKCNGNAEEVTVKTEPEEASYNVKEQPSPKIRRMLSVKVNLKKTVVVEDLVKKEPVENGDN